MFVLVGVDEGFLTKGFGGKNNSVWWGQVLVHEDDLGGKKHERRQDFATCPIRHCGHSCIKNLLLVRKTLRVGSKQAVLFQCQACGTFDYQLTWGYPPVSSRTTRKDLNTLPSNGEAYTRPRGCSHTPSDGLAHTSPQGDPQGAFRKLRRRGTSRTAARQSFEPSRGRAYGAVVIFLRFIHALFQSLITHARPPNTTIPSFNHTAATCVASPRGRMMNAIQ